MKQQYNHLVFAGTFDHLHKGHKKMIDMAFELSKEVSLGVTTDFMSKDKRLAKEILTYTVRMAELKHYLIEKGYKAKNIFKLEDSFGPSIQNNSFDSILVSEDTKKGAVAINQIRLKSNLKPLAIHIVPFFPASDNKPITSERIRKGEIDREGKVYMNLFNHTLLLPEEMREDLRKPLGIIIEGKENCLELAAQKIVRLIDKSKHSILITVGDIVSSSLVQSKLVPDVQIIDLRTRRMDIMKPDHADKKDMITNKAATIETKAVNALYTSIKMYTLDKKKRILIVNGEEDLLALPAILLAPLGSVVLYGQFDKGIIVVGVSEEKKQEVSCLIKKFK